MSGYLMSAAEAESDLARLGEVLSGPSQAAWEATLAGIELRFGRGRLSEVGSLVAAHGPGRVLVVTDAGVRGAGHLERALASLAESGREVVIFDLVRENPDADLVAQGAAVGEAAAVLVGLGGGSALDTTRAINFVLAGGGRMEDYWGWGKARGRLLPSIGIPTTAGTGSEAQSYALISQPGSGRKMACGDPSARFRSVILDPDLVATAPRSVRGQAGLDALAHAVETAVTREGSTTSRTLSRWAWERLEPSLEGALAGAAPQQAAMLLGAYLAGAAIEQSMLGAAHAAANPLTARHGAPHGVAVALMLPVVVRYNGQDQAAAAGYASLAPGIANPTEAVAGRVEALRAEAGLPSRLREIEVPRSALPDLAEAATREWTGGFNPRPMSREAFLELYDAVY